MLTLRADQVHLLADAAFARRLSADMRIHRAPLVEHLPDFVLERRIRAALLRAKRHGFTWESSFASYFTLMLELGPSFDERPEFRLGLSCRLPSESDRIRVVRLVATAEQLAAAASARHESDWRRIDSGEADCA
jgi:hypothetical protein